MNLTQVMPMREDIPQTVESIRLALEAQAKERNEVERQCGIHFDGDRPYLPGKVLTFAQKEADALFTAPSAIERVHTMQLVESTRAGDLATQMAPLAYGQDISTLTARQRAFLLYAATYALRAQDDRWTDAAHRAAVDAADTWMKTEGGKVFRDVSDGTRHALAVHLSSAVICAFINLLEGSRHIAPAAYLRICEDGQ
jgi:hypothetical protein